MFITVHRKKENNKKLDMKVLWYNHFFNNKHCSYFMDVPGYYLNLKNLPLQR